MGGVTILVNVTIIIKHLSIKRLSLPQGSLLDHEVDILSEAAPHPGTSQLCHSSEACKGHSLMSPEGPETDEPSCEKTGLRGFFDQVPH